jgi:hypothetical protein
MTTLVYSRFAAWAVVAGTVFLVGCSGGTGDPNRPDTAPVTGVVTLDGKPVEGASVSFQAQEGQHSAFGQTNAEGRYQLTTFVSGDGAVPGKYVVTIRKTESVGGNAVPQDDPNYGKQPLIPPTIKFIVPEKYSNPKTSGLTATVSEGENDIPFELTK